MNEYEDVQKRVWLFIKTNENLICLCISVLFCFVWGIVTHGEIIFNKFSVHDDLANIFGYAIKEGSYTSGRWAAEILQLFFRGLYGGKVYSIAPYNMFFAFTITGFITYYLCKLLDVNNVILVFVIAGFLVNFPSFTSMTGYVYTIVFNQIAYFLVILSVYMLFQCDKGRYTIIMPIIFTSFAIGIYQAVIPFFIALILIKCMCLVLKGELVNLKRILVIFLQCFSYSLSSLVMYIVGLKISLKIHDAELSSYQGIDTAGTTSISGYIKRISNCYVEFFFPERCNSADVYPQTIRLLYYVVIVLIAVFLLFKIHKMVCDKRFVEAIMLLGLAVLLPVGLNFIYLMCDPKITHIYSIMKYTNVLVFILACVLLDVFVSDVCYRAYKFVVVGSMAIVLLSVVFYSRYSNVCYLVYQLKFTQAISYFTELKTRIESCQGYYSDIPVVFVNGDSKEEPVSNSIDEFPEVTIPPYATSIINDYNWVGFMYRWLGYKPNIVYLDDDFLLKNGIENMNHYPEDNSIEICDGVLVVNF